MLDRGKLLDQIQRLSENIFYDVSPKLIELELLWQQIVNDQFASKKLSHASCASWLGALNDTFVINPEIAAYSIISVDGSQIYPDRHQGTLCYVLNIGFVQLSYGFDYKKVIFNSKPLLFLPEQTIYSVNDQEAINYQRQELELQEGIERGIEFKQIFPQKPFLVLFDGALLFNQLEKDEDKNLFIDRYLSLLYKSFTNQIPIASYISLPRSKELITLLSQYNSLHPDRSFNKDLFDDLVDSHLISLFLKPYERTTIFSSNNVHSNSLPQQFQLCFFYLHCGVEIVRIELPYWIAENESQVTQIASLILNQTLKGFGYPVCLAESHEQAVVKGPDREFFYQLINTFSNQYRQQITASQKSLKKRRINI